MTTTDERHLGWGYAERRSLSRTRREALDRAVLRQANTLGLDYEALFHWVNSKLGRWTCDEATDPTRTLTSVVGSYLTADKVAQIVAEATS